jgi:hypothetical protein
MPAEWLTGLERSLADDPSGEQLPVALVVLAAMAARDVALDPEEAHGAVRRALLLLAAGGDPARGLDLNGRAVSSLADDLDSPERRAALAEGLAGLIVEATGLPYVSEAVRALAAETDVAWRAYACSLLAEDLAGDQ